MDSEALDRGDWQMVLDGVTARHVGDLVTIEVLDPTLGPQHEAERLPFSYLGYDPRDDVVIAAVGGRPPRYPVVLRHMIVQPQEIDVATTDVPGTAVRIVAQDGTPTLVTFYPARPREA
ncbi:DUF5335 family protein [Streptomyces sp. NPDC006207]